MKAFGVGRSKGKPTAGPALQPLSLCLLNGRACWGTRVAATKIANRSFRKKRAKDFFYVCLSLYNSILTVKSSIHKTQGQFFFFFFFQKSHRVGYSQKRPLSGVLKRMVFSPNHFTEAKQTNTKS